MPAKSIAQRKLMAIAEHYPDKVYRRNESVKEMSKKQLKEFAETIERKLPKHVKRGKK